MRKKMFVMIVAMAAVGLFSFPYIRHYFAIYQLQIKSIDLSVPKIANVEMAQAILARNFVMAACGQDSDDFELLMKTRFDVNLKLENGLTALHCTAASGQLQRVRVLLDRGANISARATIGRPRDGDFAPIHLAAAWHHLNVVELLKSRGANINESSLAGTPLMIALTSISDLKRFSPVKDNLPSNTELIGVYQAFQRMGANLDVVDDQGNNLLHVAMTSRQRPLIEAMLASGHFDLNAQNNNGDTPFMKYHGADLDLIAQLIDKGANVNARNHSGYARILGSAYEPELFDLLVQRGADLFVAQDSGASIWSELKYQPSSVVIIFADKLAELRTPKKTDGKPGSGPLHVFALESRVDLVAYFLKRGVYADERDDSGNTPLHLAKDITIVSLLLNAGADPNARNAVDATPLMKASRYPPTALRLLIAKGADVNAVTKGTGKEKHVLDYFTEANNLEGLQILVESPRVPWRPVGLS